jgi:hypothetical protein
MFFQKSLLSELIQEIEPLDVSLIQKDVPPATLDAMKRTISGMLGLLPSDRFQVFIEAWWESLSKLLVSSMMTGYTIIHCFCHLAYMEHDVICLGPFRYLMIKRQRKLLIFIVVDSCMDCSSF